MNIMRILGVLMLCLGISTSAFAAAEVNLNGSTTVLPIMQQIAEDYMAINPDVTLVISGTGSGNGIKALNDGLCDIAMSSRDIQAKEVELATSRNIKPFRITIAVDALLPVVHPENAVSALSVAQLRDIYAGKITNWKEVGGADKEIAVISRDTSSGTYETWNERIMSGEKVAPSALLQASNGAVVQAVAGNPNAIGYVGFGYTDPSIKGLNVDGVTATAETALSNTWPIARELFLFTNGEPAGASKNLIDYILDPQKGQQAVAATGFIPLPSK